MNLVMPVELTMFLVRESVNSQMELHVFPGILDLFTSRKSLDIKRGRVHVNLRMAIYMSDGRLDSTAQARIEITNVVDFSFNDGTRCARGRTPRVGECNEVTS